MQKQLNSVFDNKSKAEMLDYAETLDEINKQFDVYTDSKKNTSNKKSGKKENKRLIC